MHCLTWHFLFVCEHISLLFSIDPKNGSFVNPKQAAKQLRIAGAYSWMYVN
jgi:hypothetical protein